MRLAWRASSRTRRASSRTAKSCFHSSSNVAGSSEKICFGFGEEREVDAGFAAFDLGQVFPDFVGGEAQDGCDKADESFGDLPEDGLRGAAFLARRRKGVHAVFEHVEIERAEVDDGEIVDGVVDAMEFESRRTSRGFSR